MHHASANDGRPLCRSKDGRTLWPRLSDIVNAGGDAFRPAPGALWSVCLCADRYFAVTGYFYNWVLVTRRRHYGTDDALKSRLKVFLDDPRYQVVGIADVRESIGSGRQPRLIIKP